MLAGYQMATRYFLHYFGGPFVALPLLLDVFLLRYQAQGGGGGVMFSYIRRLGPFFWVKNFEFRYFFGFSEK